MLGPDTAPRSSQSLADRTRGLLTSEKRGLLRSVSEDAFESTRVRDEVESSRTCDEVAVVGMLAFESTRVCRSLSAPWARDRERWGWGDAGSDDGAGKIRIGALGDWASGDGELDPASESSRERFEGSRTRGPL